MILLHRIKRHRMTTDRKTQPYPERGNRVCVRRNVLIRLGDGNTEAGEEGADIGDALQRGHWNRAAEPHPALCDKLNVESLLRSGVHKVQQLQVHEAELGVSVPCGYQW